MIRRPPRSPLFPPPPLSRSPPGPPPPPARRPRHAASAAASPRRAAPCPRARSPAGSVPPRCASGWCRTCGASALRFGDEPAAADHADHDLLAGDIPVGVEGDSPRHSLERRLPPADLRQVVPDRLPAAPGLGDGARQQTHGVVGTRASMVRSEEHTSELQSRLHLVCRLLLEK